MNNLSEQGRQLILGLTLTQLSDLIRDILWTVTGGSERFYLTGFYLVKWFEDEIDDLSAPKKIELTKELCDRIELKLMEQAQ